MCLCCHSQCSNTKDAYTYLPVQAGKGAVAFTRKLPPNDRAGVGEITAEHERMRMMGDKTL